MINKSPIMQMYYGERGNSESIKNSQNFFRLLKLVAESDEEFRRKLAEFPELLAFYKKTNDQIEEMHAESVSQHYAEGFRFGFLLALDVTGIHNT